MAARLAERIQKLEAQAGDSDSTYCQCPESGGVYWYEDVIPETCPTCGKPIETIQLKWPEDDAAPEQQGVNNGKS